MTSTSSAPPDSPRVGEQLIYVSDESAEAERLVSALRARGYSVVEVPLALLSSRVATQVPALVLCDVDAAGSLSLIHTLRDSAHGEGVQVVFLGNAGRTLESHAETVLREGSASFIRPVDIYALLSKVEVLIGAPEPSHGQAPASIRPARRPSPLAPATSTPPASERGSKAAPTEQAPRGSEPPRVSRVPHRPARLEPGSEHPGKLLFGLEPERGGARPALLPSLSPELATKLRLAEQRLKDSRASVEPREPETPPPGEVELSAELMAALAAPLDEEDVEDGAESVSDFGTGASTGGPATATGHSRAGQLEPSTNVHQAELVHDSLPPGTQAQAPPSAPKLPPLEGQDPAEPGPHDSVTTPPGPRQTGPAPGSWLRPPPLSTTTPPPTPPAIPRPPVITSLNEPLMVPRAAAAEAGGLTRAEPRSPASEHEALALPPLASAAAPPPPALELPPTLGPGGATAALARAIKARFSGALAFSGDGATRHVAFRDGDFVTASSTLDTETLLAFLLQRGSLSPHAVHGLRLPAFGRHAGAALIAHGHLRQDELWSVLRAHAEWLVGRIAGLQHGAVGVEPSSSPRLQSEPTVFGGATGAEVFVEILRRATEGGTALATLGGPRARVAAGPSRRLLAECALAEREHLLVSRADGVTLGELVEAAGSAEFAATLLALTQLGVIEVLAPAVSASGQEPAAPRDALDDDAIKQRIAVRRRLVDEGDYFSLLGVARDATTYDIKRAYLDLRREYDPGRLLTPGTAHLLEDVTLILELLDEAFEILSDGSRRARYRRALEAPPL